MARKVRGEMADAVAGRCNGGDIREMREELGAIFHNELYILI